MNQAPQQDGVVTFRATILLGGKTATGVRVPDEIVEQLNAGKRPRVHVTVNGYTYRSTVAPMRGKFMLPVSADVREKSGVAAHDEVEVCLRPDTEPRTITVPADFEDAMRAVPHAQDSFNTLSYSNRQRVVLSIEGAKTDETRRRRISKAVAALGEEH